MFIINCAPPTALEVEIVTYYYQIYCEFPDGGLDHYIQIAGKDTLEIHNERLGSESRGYGSIKTGEKISVSIQSDYDSRLFDRQTRALIYINGEIMIKKFERNDHEVSLYLEYIIP
jgi:hypothetical protein